MILTFTLLLANFTGFAFAQTPTKDYWSADDPINPGSDVSVFIEFPGVNVSTRSNADVALVMDLSGSMSNPFSGFAGTTKIQAAKDAMTTFASRAQEDYDQLGLVSYTIDPCPWGGVNSFGGCARVDTCNVSDCAILESDVDNMTPVNQASLITAIEGLAPVGATPIGAGMEVAIQELIAKARSDAGQFMILATDGLQNTIPSPYQDNILQDAIDNNITIFTIGIGDDVQDPTPLPMVDSGNDYCFGCPDLDGDGATSGEEIMQDVACRTDSDCNDPLTEANYYFADSADRLNEVYDEIQAYIEAATAYIGQDIVNSAVFDTGTVRNASVRDVQCDLWKAAVEAGAPAPGSLVTPIIGPNISGGVVLVMLREIPSGQANCLKFDVTVRSDVLDGDFLVDQPTVLPHDATDPFYIAFNSFIPECKLIIEGDFGIDWDMSDFVACLSVLSGSVDELPNKTLTVVAIAPPWIKTTQGDVGALGDIKMTRDPVGPPAIVGSNADYLIAVSRSITDDYFTSAKEWLVEGYSFDPNSLETSGDIYGDLYEKYRNRVINPVDLSDETTVITAITSAAVSSSGILMWGADAEFKDPRNYGGKPVVVFINGDLTITKKVKIAADTGLIFIVNGEIKVDGSVREIDGFYLATGEFKSRIGATEDRQLVVDGSVIAYGGIDLKNYGRTLGTVCTGLSLCDRFDPAELFNYQSRYLYLFRQIAGESKTIFKELAP